MEPTADGLVEVTTSESHPSAAVTDEAVATLSSNGHAAPAVDGDAFDLHLLHALQLVHRRFLGPPARRQHRARR